MNNDLVNKALDQAKVLQKTVADAISKGAEAAHPLIEEAVTRAADLKETLAHGAAGATEAAKPHLEGALGHLNSFIALGKSAVESGVAKVQEQLEPLAEQVRKTIDSTTQARTEPTAKTPEEADPAKDASPT